ncbi:DUF5691 domain-containing protein [uncultured Desulfovibrio sp.]|uniref:DUF5691 domain-containing protein n=1 Tax=uncultured Desulfovibrio sp. TaxID=167968 RepID=UPI00262544C8|nr:DUF5691 domain-containing protein [uncultured Desulfovibrio sp.]
MAINELARLCIVGTDKGGAGSLAGDASPTGAVLRELEALPARGDGEPREEAARKCLLASGISALRTLELAEPQPGEELPPALEEELPEGPCPGELFSRYPYEIVSWLHRRGRRLPSVFLPEAVRWAASGRHDEILPVLGRSGARLCRDNPAWLRLLADCAGVAAEPSGEVDLSLWDEASPEARCMLLRRLRERNPRAGRELAEPLLRKQFPRNKKLLYALRSGLSAEDIPLLEECSRKKYDASGIHPARMLLSLLPESDFARELAAGDIFVWKGGTLALKPGDAQKEWTEGLPEDVCLTICPLDVWLARSGRDCKGLLSFLMGKPLLAPLTTRIFLEDRKDWLRAGLETALEAGAGESVPSGLHLFGTLAAVMLPREEVEGWLSRLLGGGAPANSRVCDALAAPMLLYARFPVPRELWSDYVGVIGRRAEALRAEIGTRKDVYFNSMRLRAISALWGDEERDGLPADLEVWTCREFRGAHGLSLLFHAAWEMPLELLEGLEQALRSALPDADMPLFVKMRQELEDIRRFRAREEQV